jgi:hypothetical protein
MEVIKEKKFYHIQSVTDWRKTPLLKIGDVIECGVEINPFVGFLYNPSVYSESFNAAENVKHAFESQSNLNFPANVTYYFACAAQHHQKTLREVIFESVRANHYPELPSRTSCLWVIPTDDKENLQQWLDIIGGNGELLEVELTGKVHKGNEFFLKMGTFKNIEDYYSHAHNYWQSTHADSAYEYLFEGTCKIVNSHKRV